MTRHADEPGKTVNVDLCFVPMPAQEQTKADAETSVAAAESPAENSEDDTALSYPGQIFADSDLSYEEAMNVYADRRAQVEAKATQTADAEWQRRRDRQRMYRQEREAQDKQWRQARQEIRQRKAALNEKVQALVSQWVAILVILDNCTRQCLALPLFVAGKHVTAEMVVAALKEVLPSNLRFLISDNGPQFIAQVMADLATELAFRQVRISPRRAKTNGIAERFVRTLREMLAQHTWQVVKELLALLPRIVAEYNDRPHQGKELRGLSPNEYARRLHAQAIQVT